MNGNNDLKRYGVLNLCEEYERSMGPMALYREEERRRRDEWRTLAGFDLQKMAMPDLGQTVRAADVLRSATSSAQDYLARQSEYVSGSLAIDNTAARAIRETMALNERAREVQAVTSAALGSVFAANVREQVVPDYLTSQGAAQAATAAIAHVPPQLVDAFAGAYDAESRKLQSYAMQAIQAIPDAMTEHYRAVAWTVPHFDIERSLGGASLSAILKGNWSDVGLAQAQQIATLADKLQSQLADVSKALQQVPLGWLDAAQQRIVTFEHTRQPKRRRKKATKKSVRPRSRQPSTTVDLGFEVLTKLAAVSRLSEQAAAECPGLPSYIRLEWIASGPVTKLDTAAATARYKQVPVLVHFMIEHEPEKSGELNAGACDYLRVLGQLQAAVGATTTGEETMSQPDLQHMSDALDRFFSALTAFVKKHGR